MYLLVAFIFIDEASYVTVSPSWTQWQFFEVIGPEEIAYVYKIKPTLDFGIQLVSYVDKLSL